MAWISFDIFLMYFISLKGVFMTKIDLRNSVTECAQSVKKENAGKYYNYSIKDCMKSIAAQKR